MPNQLIKKLNLITKSIILLIVTASAVNAQEKKEVPDIESIYLHTDQTHYTLGESLWYKAYSVYPYNNQLYSKSKILYVELIDSDSKIIARNKTKLEDGLGNGDFKLTDSTGVKKPGTYQLRAYTNWNRNFDESFIFNKEIEILSVYSSQEDNKTSAKSKKNKTKSEEIKHPLNIQFFPEGGSLLEDVNSVISLKAVDNNGFPMKVEGAIYTANDSLVTIFRTIHDGMGKFQLTPTKGDSYYAKTSSINGNEDVKTMLPQVRPQGYVLSSRQVKDKQMIVVKTNNNTLLSEQNKPIKIICTFKGVTYFEIEQPITNNTVWFEIPKAQLPAGINQITLFDANERPQSERLIFIDQNDDLNITLNTDKKIYKPNEKVTVTVSSKTKTGEAVPASYSLSSIDMNGLEDNSLTSNICSYYLMESDIKGKVHNPGHYFDKNNPSRLDKLDLLLSTQGWRDFLWKEMPKFKDNRAPYLSEQGLNLKGRLTQTFGNKGKPDNHITLTLYNKGKLNMLTAISDELGQFRFNDLMFYGKSDMILSSVNDKGKGKGMISLDDTRAPMAVNFKPALIKPETIQTEVLKEHVLKKYVSFGVMTENVLDEIEITGKKKEEPKSIYGSPDHSYSFDDEVRSFSTIYQLIQFTVPGLSISGSSIKFARNNGPAQIMVDGVPWPQSDISFMQPDDVAKIESFNSASTVIFGSDGANGVILIYTKEGALNRTKNVNHTIKQELEGFYEARVFYTPEPKSISFENQKEAVRNTLYWNPYLHPGETGTTQTSYYNSAVETNVKITIEGVTATGVPVVVKTNYAIEK
ncbi:TonB-dependent receptor [Algibacter miyuki]|uniref:TonB-dependent receptor n=1 Tax=Algibacter miyuki TaxID=1306933 RepID=A0ABV5GX01_9FLAO|nr:TonB-dependent receptor plug domain-containing protein [Algibacter miyuki]MDN3665035.1 TonB-dependent receptor plug domain-containing protein [Algibacter miyuki]